MIIKEKVFADNHKWFKGNLHAHTTNSDGKLTPAQAVLAYKQHGYNFMCLSDHDYFTDLCEEFNTENFILLPGVEGSVRLIDDSALNINVDEYTDGKGYADYRADEIWDKLKDIGEYRLLKTHHIHGILGNKAMQEAAGENCIRPNEYTPMRVYFGHWDGAKAAQDLSDYMKAKGCFTTYNHPIWSRIDTEDIKDIDGFWAIEVYNYASVNECGEGEDTTFWDYLMRHGTYVNCFASDDNHNEGIYPDSFGGYVMVQAEELTHENIINSLLEGRYYSSGGAEITQWGIKDGSVYVTCPGAKRINFVFGGKVGSSKTVVYANDMPLTHVECPIKGHETHVRIEVIDMNDKKAWTNPIILK
ncbi:MAG: PHP domain-containing protein [Oscillospiraceae bacterium]|nr:PHP domain-containing protein [Oscillospiraceae bacterium]